MLRPSRPMILPFISSPGRCSTGDHGLAGLLARDPLDGERHDPPGPLFPVAAGLGLGLADDQRGLALGLVLDGGDEFGLGLLGGQPGGPLQHLAALVVQPGELGALGVQFGPDPLQVRGPLFQLAQFAIQPAFALGKPRLPAFEVGAKLAGFLPGCLDLFLGCSLCLRDLARRLLGPPHDGRRVRLRAGPDLLGGPAGFFEPPFRGAASLRRPAFCLGGQFWADG